jgi:hypothetical protein
MLDLGDPSSYLVLQAGAEVYSSDDQPLGRVEHVLAEPDEDIFDGIVIDTSILPGGHRFADADQVDRIFERGVVLKVDAAAAESLPEPSGNPGVLEADPGEGVEGDLQRKLRAAWDRISGNY